MKKKVIILSIIGVILVGGISVGAIHQQSVKPEHSKQEEKKDGNDNMQENQEDPYKNLSKAKAENVSKLDGTVSRIVTEKLNTKPLDGLKEAEEALKVLDVDDADLKSIHEAYAGVIDVVKTPNVDALQNTRSAMANLDDADISEHMLDEYEDKLIEIVSKEKSMSKEDVNKQSKPLTPQQLKAKNDSKAKAKADKEAAEKKAAEAKRKAEADKKAKEQAERDAEAARQAEAQAEQQVVEQQVDNGGGGYVPPADNGGYTPPANDGGGGYVPPADNGGGGYTPPANNGGGASSNNAAQDAANNTPTPQPPAHNNDISGTPAPNGHVPEPGGW